MSGKGEKTADKASGSKMLKKARSFREDFKVLIKRRPSASSVPGMVGSGKSPKILVNRAGSLGDAKTAYGKDEDLDKLQAEVGNVYRSLRYIKAVVDQEKLQIVPSTATIVLDTINDVFNLLNSFFSNQDSTTLLSRHNKVCQCLAQFIKWADDSLVHRDRELNKTDAHELIASLSAGVEELTQICIDKWDDRKNTIAPPRSPAPHSPSYDTPKRSSLPDIPLTPREREILEKTSDLGVYDNQSSITGSRSSDAISLPSNGTSYREPSPPPKPPLPQNLQDILPQLLQRSSSEVDATDSGEIPPPLPDKEKRRSQIQSMLEMVSNAGLHYQLTPDGRSPQGSMLLSGNTSFTDYSGSPLSQSPSLSPSTQSPASSVSSGLNQSSDDLGQGVQRTQRANTFSRTSSDSKMLKGSGMSSSHSECTVHQIEEVTKEINKMISDIGSLNKKQETNNGSGPPPLPNKAGRLNRHVSHYDNMPDGATLLDISSGSSQTTRTIISRTVTNRTSQSSHSSEARLSSSSTGSQQSFSGQMQKSNTISFTQRTSSQDTYSSSDTFSSTSHSSMESLAKPPPLPPKQRHIQAYMQTFGDYTHPTGLEYISRHSINFYEAQWHRHQMELSHSMYPRSNTISVISDFSSESSFSGSAPGSPSIPALPAKRRFNRDSQVSVVSSQSDTSADVSREKTLSLVEPALLPSIDQEQKRASAPAGQVIELAPKESVEPPAKPEIPKDADSDFAELNPLDDIDVSDQLIRKKEGEDGPDIRGGSIDSLIVHAAAAAKSEFMYQEAFLTTYRTFITSRELIDKLLYRFHKFHHAQDNKKKTARNAFSLLIRVIDLLSSHELDSSVIECMMELVFELLCQGDLMLARILRRKVIEKCETKKVQQEAAQHVPVLSSMSVTSNPYDLLHFKPSEVAEQMTYIDAELFQRIEIPEVLLWAKEQSEELSPNLTCFTEHFNKMSYWCRTRILLQEELKDREKYMNKFIKIMRHLRKMSNFNSYLAILSALDSAPIRRLEWQKQTLDALKEFCQLIDSSASFRAYRVALAETEPPCIPYIGLILQDLTFINIGNQDNLPDGSINFAKRWQQFHILDNMRRFRDKKCNYEIKKNEKILSMFDNFDDYLGEEALWQISEKIKPRGGRRKTESEL